MCHEGYYSTIPEERLYDNQEFRESMIYKHNNSVFETVLYRWHKVVCAQNIKRRAERATFSL